MAPQLVKIECADKTRHDVGDVLRLEPYIDDGGWCDRAFSENQVAEIAVTGDQDALLRDRVGQDGHIVRVGHDMYRTNYVVASVD